MNDRLDENAGELPTTDSTAGGQTASPVEAAEPEERPESPGAGQVVTDDDDELARAATAAGGPAPALGAPPVRRRRAGLGVWLAIAAAAAVLAVVYGPPFLRRVGELRIQRACAEYVAPPKLIVYEEQPERASVLIAHGSGHVAVPLPPGGGPPVAGHVPEAWRQMRRWTFPAAPQPAGALLFVHERQTAVGVRGILAVEADRAARRLRVSFIHPGTYGSAPTPVTDLAVKQPPKEGMVVWHEGRDPFESMLPAGDPAARADLRFFAGQPDADDWTHLVIPYELGNESGELEMWVVDESTVHYVDRRFARK